MADSGDMERKDSYDQLSAMLLIMELDGKVVANHGRYCRKP